MLGSIFHNETDIAGPNMNVILFLNFQVCKILGAVSITGG